MPDKGAMTPCKICRLGRTNCNACLCGHARAEVYQPGDPLALTPHANFTLAFFVFRLIVVQLKNKKVLTDAYLMTNRVRPFQRRVHDRSVVYRT